MDERIARLRRRNVYLGTSSWKYAGWKGLVYRKPYRTEKEFNDTCLAEYAEHFTTVGVDHTYYAWPTEPAFSKYVDQTPDGFRFGLKATEKVTVFHYPKLKRYGKEAGKRNESFLDASLFQEKFLLPLEPFKQRLGPIMLEFSQFYPGTIASGSEFVERLDVFFNAVKGSGFQFSIEIRNANWLKAPYFECLTRHGVAHVFNSWTRMPTILEQLEQSRDAELPMLVSRVLLQPGTKYEEAVEAFSPYDRLQETHPALRQGGAALIRRALDAGVPAYVFVNNRAEGCAPLTIAGILDILDL